MFWKKITGAAAAVVMAVSFASASTNAFAANRHSKYKSATSTARTVSRGTMPPFAYIQFCVKNRAACRNTAGKLAMAGGNKVKLTKHLEQQLASVNQSVNSSMRPRRDGSSDRWAVGGKAGDCEDFAMTKRARLIAAGWPSSALSITVVRTRSGEGHAVLAVHTSHGTLVLDNLSKSVRPLRRVPYKIIAMQTGSPMQWRR
jgi:predicted transglutaminase-like cysteine proteinase